MFNKLYFIGNGFDLHHGLKTSYLNFRDDYIKKKSSVLWNDLLDIYGDAPQNDNLWWKDFDENTCAIYSTKKRTIVLYLVII